MSGFSDDLHKDMFFDVLIDQIIADVRTELTAKDPRRDEGSRPQSADLVNDLVSRMIDFKTRNPAPAQVVRMAYSSASTSAPRRASFNPNANPDAQASDTTPITPDEIDTLPFSSVEMMLAFSAVVHFGAVFSRQDLEPTGELSATALKRERRRVLLELHPDRVFNKDRRTAHTEFLEAAEAFKTLAVSFAAPHSTKPRPQEDEAA
ncbi:MAG: hypothetical protein RBT63_09150 [Bdellovibrionales bacterium]|jgi:hypothetical protein|nr:hypothetical protein [Bdellovibrionales bacterium]